jgi:poly-beta-1,6-N-acetyl-D-glucosamine synthase
MKKIKNTIEKPRVTIGICAYNEEANIGHLLHALLKQKEVGHRLEKIVVISDASTDNTDKTVSLLNDSRIVLYRNKTKIGKAMSQELLFGQFTADVLVVLDADVIPEDVELITNLVNAFKKQKNIGLVGGKHLPLTPKNILETALHYSRAIYNSVFVQMNEGSNVYLCHGSVRAFHRDLVRILKWKPASAEDAYSYFSCIANNFVFVYEPTATVRYKLPDTLRDHYRQSVRFFGSRKGMKRYFDSDLVDAEYHISFTDKIKILTLFISRNPMYACVYMLVFISAKVRHIGISESGPTWKTSHSSKRLITKKSYEKHK